jgi:hypothetical protein
MNNSIMNHSITTLTVPATAISAATAAGAATGAGEALSPMSPNVSDCPRGENALSPKQHAAIELLLVGRSIGDIARTLDIDRRTLHRWRFLNASFEQELRARRAELWSIAADRLKAMVHASLDVLEKELADRFDRTRHRAAVTILRLSDLRKATQEATS